MIRFEIDDLSALALNQQSLFSEFLDNGFHLIRIEPFACITVKANVQLFIDFLDVFHREVFEPVKKVVAFLISALDELEIPPRLVFEFGILLCLSVKTDVEIVDGTNSACLDLLFISPMTVSGNQLAELRSVIAQMIDSDRIVSEEPIGAVECASDDGGREVSDVERLCDVDGRIVDTDGLPLSLIAAAVLLSLRFDFGKNVRCKPPSVYLKVEITVDGGNLADHVVHGVRMFESLRNRLRRFSHHLCKAKTGKRVIPHFRVRRKRDHIRDFFLRESLYVQMFCDISFIIHKFTNQKISFIQSSIIFENRQV